MAGGLLTSRKYSQDLKAGCKVRTAICVPCVTLLGVPSKRPGVVRRDSLRNQALHGPVATECTLLSAAQHANSLCIITVSLGPPHISHCICTLESDYLTYLNGMLRKLLMLQDAASLSLSWLAADKTLKVDVGTIPDPRPQVWTRIK